MIKGNLMDRIIKWRLGNKSEKNLSWEELEKKKYSNEVSLKQAAYTPIPPLDQIYYPPDRYYVADVNFVITNRLAREIERTPGVKHMRPTEPYSFFIAVKEEFFNPNQVMSEINKKLKAKTPKKV